MRKLIFIEGKGTVLIDVCKFCGRPATVCPAFNVKLGHASKRN